MADSTHWINIYCRCGHSATVSYAGPWQHRDQILPRARCTACGRRGALSMRVSLPPGDSPGTPGYQTRG